jgi:putative PIN family toxin of toxin-antitoxin system
MLNPPRAGESLRVVLDTNVLLSLFAFADSRLAPVRRALDAGQFVALTRDDCLAEWRRVLGYKSFAWPHAKQDEAYVAYSRIAQRVGVPPNPAFVLPRCKDRDDQKFLEVARDGAAHYLVSADGALLGLAPKRLLCDHVKIVTPDRFMALVTT